MLHIKWNKQTCHLRNACVKLLQIAMYIFLLYFCVGFCFVLFCLFVVVCLLPYNYNYTCIATAVYKILYMQNCFVLQSVTYCGSLFCRTCMHIYVIDSQCPFSLVPRLFPGWTRLETKRKQQCAGRSLHVDMTADGA